MLPSDLSVADVSTTLERLDRRFPQALVGLPSGAQVAVRTAGDAEAPVVVLLHGIGSGAASWFGVAEALASSARVVAWEAPGYGASSPVALDDPHPDPLPPAGEGAGRGARRGALSLVAGEEDRLQGPLPVVRAADGGGARQGLLSRSPERAGVGVVAAYAGRLAELLAALELESFALVGHSLGALIAAAYAGGPGAAKVRRLILLDPAHGYGAPERAAERAQVRAKRLDTLRHRGIAGIADDAPARMLSASATAEARAWVRWNASRLDPAGYAAAVELLCDADIGTAAGRLAMPCDVHCGEHDTITPPDACRAIAARLGAGFGLIAGAGHAAPVERPDAVARLLLAGLARPAERSAPVGRRPDDAAYRIERPGPSVGPQPDGAGAAR